MQVWAQHVHPSIAIRSIMLVPHTCMIDDAGSPHLYSWVRAMDTYNRVAKVVGPKKIALKEAEQKLSVVQV